MATINLGSIKFKWQGAYNGATAYTVDDVVSYNGSSYICILASTGNLPTNTTYWEQMSSAGTNGTNGTDLGTTLTTQGDIVYRDASGLARLGAGTSGQVLTTGGAGANPSWTNLSSDYVLIAETDVTVSTASVTLNNFSSTYKNYKLFVSGLSSSTAGASVYFRWLDNGSEFSGSNYQSVYHYAYVNNTTDVNSHGKLWSSSNHRLMEFDISASDTASTSFEMTIFNPLSSTQEVTAQAQFHINQGNYNYILTGTSSFGFSDTRALSGIKFYLNTGSFDKGNFKLYGIK